MTKGGIRYRGNVEGPDNQDDHSECVGDGVTNPGGKPVSRQRTEGRAKDNGDHVDDGPESAHDFQGSRSGGNPSSDQGRYVRPRAGSSRRKSSFEVEPGAAVM